MGLLNQVETLEIISNKAVEKSKMNFAKLCLLGIFGGAYIAFGFVAAIRVSAIIPALE